MKLLKLYIFLAALLLVGSCNDYVSSIDQPIDDATDDNLNSPSDVSFLIKGVQTAFSIVWDETSVMGNGLSDEQLYGYDIPGASYTTFEAIDLGQVTGRNPLDATNNSTAGIMLELGRLRLLADTLIERVYNRITFDDTEQDIKKSGLYTGFFYGAVARYIWATYWCLNPYDGGGGVINLSPYIPATTLYNDALALLDSALLYAAPGQDKNVYSLQARILLFQGKWQEASDAATAGLAQGDPNFAALYNTVEQNYWYYWAGVGRTQFYADDRFGDYVYNDPKEAARVLFTYVDGATPFTPPNDTVIAGVEYTGGVEAARKYVVQTKYADFEAPIPFLTWQEMTLIKAEAAIRQTQNAVGLGLVNEVRQSYGLDDITDQMVQDDYNGNYLDMLFVERDKELSFTGMRLPDQRRFDKWHLNPSNSWQRLPIIQRERDVNPNL